MKRGLYVFANHVKGSNPNAGHVQARALSSVSSPFLDAHTIAGEIEAVTASQNEVNASSSSSSWALKLPRRLRARAHNSKAVVLPQEEKTSVGTRISKFFSSFGPIWLPITICGAAGAAVTLYYVPHVWGGG
jgi:hypothetical protein